MSALTESIPVGGFKPPSPPPPLYPQRKPALIHVNLSPVFSLLNRDAPLRTVTRG